MNKIVTVALLAIIISAVALLAYLLLGSIITPGLPPFSNSHFAVMNVTYAPIFEGENLLVQASILDDEPMREMLVAGVEGWTETNEDGSTYTTAVPTTEMKLTSGNATHTQTATLTGGDESISRSKELTLSNNEGATLLFDFGPLPAGAYVVTVTAPSYRDSSKSAAVSVGSTPMLSRWTTIGDISILLYNLEHDNVDVNIRNDGQHAVVFGGSQYTIFANASDTFGVPLRGMDATLVKPGETLTVHATIPAAGNYYLDHFAIKAPSRDALVKIMVNAPVNAS